MKPLLKRLSKQKLFLMALAVGSFVFISSESLAASCPGITRASHPYGLTYPAFNCYTDNYALGGAYGGDEREQNFLRVQKNGTTWSDQVSADVGDTVNVFVYAHNSAKDGQFPAQNAQILVDWSNPSNVFSRISANNTNPRVVDDNTTINLANGTKLEAIDLRVSGRGTQSVPAGSTSANVTFNSFLGSYSNVQGVIVRFRVVANNQTPSIRIDKDDSTPGTPDTDGNDTQSIDYGGTATFTITVTNDGPVALRNVSISDPLAPSCSLSVVLTTLEIQTIGNQDAFFDPGESFNYLCNANNVTAPFTNIATVNGNSVVDNTAVTDSDPTDVYVRPAQPNINIDKDDSTPGTPDTDGDDSQTVASGGTADFTITVTNNGQVDLRNVRINDPEAPNCVRTDAQTRPLIAAVGNQDNIFNVGESFTYTCNDTNVLAAYTNLAQVEGTPVNGQADVIDSDTSEVLLELVPRIDIDKDDSTPGTADIDGDDFQIVFSGNTATFTITVTNSGPVALRDVVITDPLSPSCSRTAAQTLSLYPGNTFAPGQSFQYQCTQDNVTQGFTNVANVTGISVVDGIQVVDNDDTVVEVPPLSPIIDIDKDDSTPGDPDTDGDDTQTVNVGSAATFTITVTNVGNENLRNVVITDPNNPACNLTAAQTNALISQVGNRDNILNAGPANVGESFTYTCNDPSVQGPYINTANVVGVGVTRGDVVTDSDPTTVNIPGGENPSINIDKDDSDNQDDTQTVVSGGTANFTIVVTNDGNVGLERVSIGDNLAPNCSLDLVLTTLNIQAVGDQDAVFDPGESFSYTCNDPNVTASYTNTANVSGFSIFSGTQVTDSDPTDIVVRSTNPVCSNSAFNLDTVRPGADVIYNWTVNADVPANAQLVCAGAGVNLSEDIAGRNSRTITIPNTAADGDVLTCTIVMPDNTSLCSDTVTVDTGGGGNDAAITIDKNDNDNNDDTQQINRGATANFTITVTNTGLVNLRDIVINDPKAPTCVRSAAETAALIQVIGNNDQTLDVGESFRYVCSGDNWTDTSNTAIVVATPTNGDANVTDEDSTQITFPTGGGGGRTIPSVGTCAINDLTDSLQCIARKPVEFGPGWAEFDRCRNGDPLYAPRNASGRGLKEDCVMDWAEDQGLQFCGTSVGANIDVFETAGADVGQCAPIIEPPTPGSCVPVATCPSCFKADASIEKVVVTRGDEKYSETRSPGDVITTATGSVGVAQGEKAKFEIAVHDIGINHNDYQVVNATIKVYDMTVPTQSGYLWNRPGVVDGDEDQTWVWTDGKYFQRDFTPGEIQDINRGELEDFHVYYDLNTALDEYKDVAEVKNVAFAVIEYRVRDIRNPLLITEEDKVIAIGLDRSVSGDSTCRVASLLQVFSRSTTGDTAKVKIIRPFVEARGGNLAVSGNTKVTGETGNIDGANQQGVVVESDSNNIFDGYEANNDNLESLKDNFQADRGAYFTNLKANMVSGTLPTGFNILEAPDSVMTHNYDSGIYIISGGEVEINQAIQLDRPTTFVFEGANLIISEDVTFTNHFGAFIVREGDGFTGDISIANNVRNMDGVYIAEGDSRIMALGSIVNTDTPLTVNGNLIGNLGHILSFRKYIGDNASTPLPSLVVAFDLRILESTPPILEQFLGEDWREEVSQ